MNSTQEQISTTVHGEPSKLLLILLAGVFCYFLFFRQNSKGTNWSRLLVGAGLLLLLSVPFLSWTVIRAKAGDRISRSRHVKHHLVNATRPIRREEKTDMNRKFIADIYPTERDAATSLAHQLAVKILRDEELSKVSLKLNNDSSILDATAYEEFVSELTHALRGSEVSFNATDSDYAFSFGVDNGEYQSTLSAHLNVNNEPHFDAHATFTNEPGPWRDDFAPNLGFEYGPADERGCIARAATEIDMYVRAVLPNFELNRDRINDDSMRKLRQTIMKELVVDEFRQTYRQSISGKELDRPEFRTAITFDLDRLDEVAAEHAQQFAQQHEFSGLTNDASLEATATSWGQLLSAPAGLMLVYLLALGVSNAYDTPRSQRVARRQHESDAGLGLFLAYRSFTILVGCLIPLFFVGGGLGMIDSEDSRLAGILCAIFSGLLWAGSGYARILLKAGPDESNRESVRRYREATTIGTILRSAGLILGCLCAMLFVIHSFEGDEEIKFAAIACAVFSAAPYTIAGMLEKSGGSTRLSR